MGRPAEGDDGKVAGKGMGNVGVGEDVGEDSCGVEEVCCPGHGQWRAGLAYI